MTGQLVRTVKRSGFKGVSLVAILFILLFSFLTFSPTRVMAYPSVTRTVSFPCSSNSAYLTYSAATYVPAWNSTNGIPHANGGAYYVGGQASGGNTFVVYRTILFFDTSSLPSGCNITSAIVSVYVTGLYQSSAYNMTLQNSTTAGVPHVPVATTDYYQGYWGNSGGSRAVNDSCSVNAWWNITVNTQGQSWIGTNGTQTSYMFRSTNDISESQPSGLEYITIDGYASSYLPQLVITYTYTGNFYYVTHGPYWENGTLASGYTCQVTLYKQLEPPETEYLSAGASEGVINWTTAYQPFYFSYNVTSNVLNGTRTIWLVGGSTTFQNLYIILPLPNSYALNVYYFKGSDFLGLTNAYLETRINLNGYIETVECEPWSTVNYMTFTCQLGTAYNLFIVSSQGQIDYGGWLANTNYYPIVTVQWGTFGQSYTYNNMTFYANRTSTGTSVQLAFSDPSGQTANGSITVTNYNTGALIYSGSWTGSNYLTTINNLDSQTEYLASATNVLANGNSYLWTVYLTVNTTGASNPLAVLNTFFPDSPIPLTNVVFTLLILAVFLAGSKINILMSMFLAWIIEALFVWLNWMSVGTVVQTSEALGLSFFLLVMVGFKLYREKEVTYE